MTANQDPVHFLSNAAPSPEAEALFADDMDTHGFVMNASYLWAHQPALHDQLFELIGATAKAGGLTMRQRGILVSATASTLGDAYCSLAWGTRLAGESSAATAAAVLRKADHELDAADRALVTWARRIVADPTTATLADVGPLRDAGFDDAQILAISLFVGLRLAFSSVNNALGARPDRGLVDHAPAEVAAAVTYGRPPTD